MPDKLLSSELEELRDKFAIAALNGCLSHSDTSNVAFTSVKEATEYYAKLAYAYADAMLKARGDMEFKHTPAPWKHTIRNANEIMTTFHGVTIGDVYLDITTANQKADSHLIAAAPELLEQLIRLRNKIASYKPDDEDDLDLVDTVIAKALGQQ